MDPLHPYFSYFYIVGVPGFKASAEKYHKKWQQGNIFILIEEFFRYYAFKYSTLKSLIYMQLVFAWLHMNINPLNWVSSIVVAYR